ncbi:MAG TPA: TIGR03086 family metal-binding protein [Acidimicrobiales bacterium]|nr:TIGR03086 family metal-binding protein [Acidimicrobiales bacterium]
MTDPKDLTELHRRATEEFAARVRAVADDQWHLPTPCADWDVRALVNHLVYENRWAVPLLEGRTLEEVGDRFEGDLLGDDPVAAWAEASAAALGAAGRPGALEGTVHLSYGDVPAGGYLTQLSADHVIHAWDLARAIGADERLDPELVDFALPGTEADAEMARGAGIFGPAVEIGADADPQTRLLAVTGRRT